MSNPPTIYCEFCGAKDVCHLSEQWCIDALQSIVFDLHLKLQNEKAKMDAMRPTAEHVLRVVRGMTVTLGTAQLWADVVKVCSAVAGRDEPT